MNTIYYSEPTLITESTFFFLEEANPKVQNNTLSKLLDKLRQLITRFKEWANEKISKGKIKEIETQVNAAVTKNPSLKNKKINVQDIKSADAIESDFQKEIMNARSDAEIDRAKEKRKSRLKKVAFITIPIAAVAGYIMYANRSVNQLCKKHYLYFDKLEAEITTIRGDRGFSHLDIKDLNTAYDDVTKSSGASANFTSKKKYFKSITADKPKYFKTEQKLKDAKRKMLDMYWDIEDQRMKSPSDRAKSFRKTRLLNRKLNELYASTQETYSSYRKMADLFSNDLNTELGRLNRLKDQLNNK